MDTKKILLISLIAVAILTSVTVASAKDIKDIGFNVSSNLKPVDGDGLLNKLADLEEERQILQKYKLSYMKQKIRMIKMIHKMKIGNRQTLLYRMYIKEQSLETCAQYLEWTPEYTRKQLRIALREFDEIIRSISD